MKENRNQSQHKDRPSRDKTSATAGQLIHHLHRHAQMYLDKQLEPLRLRAGSILFFRVLSHNGGINLKELSELLSIDKASTTRAIKKLEETGYVRKEIDDNDARSYRLWLTEKAEETKVKIHDIIRSWTEVLTRGFNENERKTAIALLERMVDNATEERFSK